MPMLRLISIALVILMLIPAAAAQTPPNTATLIVMFANHPPNYPSIDMTVGSHRIPEMLGFTYEIYYDEPLTTTEISASNRTNNVTAPLALQAGGATVAFFLMDANDRLSLHVYNLDQIATTDLSPWYYINLLAEDRLTITVNETVVVEKLLPGEIASFESPMTPFNEAVITLEGEELSSAEGNYGEPYYTVISALFPFEDSFTTFALAYVNTDLATYLTARSTLGIDGSDNTTYLNLLERAGLLDTFAAYDNSMRYIIPPDETLATLPSQLTDSPTDLRDWLLSLVYDADDLPPDWYNGFTINGVSGKPITTKYTQVSTQINGADLQYIADVSNGRIYFVDRLPQVVD